MRIGITFDLKCPDPNYLLPDDWQEEFDSPQTIQALAETIQHLGHEVVLLGDGRELIERLLATPPDLVFNFAEGQGVSRCREARVPALLEMLGIPYTGSDPLTLAVTLDKDVARRLVASHGVAVPPGMLVPSSPSDLGNAQLVLEASAQGNLSKLVQSIGQMTAARSRAAETRTSRWAPDDLASLLQKHGLTFPLIVKPAWEGSSKGIRQTSLVHGLADLARAIERIHHWYRQPALVEEYIAGEELTVGIIGNHPPQVLGILHVVPNQPYDHFIYSVEVKRDYRRRVRYESPPGLPIGVLDRVAEAALRAFHALGCRDVCRLDFRLRDGVPYFLEANPLPGLNPVDSDLVILARLNSWSYSHLIEAILQAALARIQMR